MAANSTDRRRKASCVIQSSTFTVDMRTATRVVSYEIIIAQGANRPARGRADVDFAGNSPQRSLR